MSDESTPSTIIMHHCGVFECARVYLDLQRCDVWVCDLERRCASFLVSQTLPVL